MKIEKIGKKIAVFVDEFTNMSFGFNLVDIVDKEDLKLKVQQRINEKRTMIINDTADEQKFNDLKLIEVEQ